MDNIKTIPLAERISGAFKADFPRGLLITAYDFLGVTGEITGEEGRYEKLYQTYIAPHDGKDGTHKRVCELIADADSMEPEDRDDILFWLLIEPFANLEPRERGQKS